jgi:hypothetical protein
MAEPSESQRRTDRNTGPPAGYVRHFRIFLASPGDVAAERKIAREVIEQLQYERQFRGKVSLEHVAWDNPGAGTLMLATISPQEAVARGQGKPSDCDIVVVIFWARMGKPLPDPPYHHETANRPYHSGTEWEYEDAMEGFLEKKRPEVVVYRRTEDPLFSPRDPDFKLKVEQWNLVEELFARFGDSTTGAIRHGCNHYESPDDFRRQFTQHLRGLVEELLQAPAPAPTPLPHPPLELWRGSPFPGLRAFTDRDAPIFFGRGRETDDLVDRINCDRFVAVVGASGSGKSSLVWAGLIPALGGNSIRSERAASSDWLWLRMTPGGVGDNPFTALAVELRPYLGREPREIAEELAAKPEAFSELIPRILFDRPVWAELLLFVDQLEELVTLVAERYREPFAKMLCQAVAAGRFRAVATLRADFYHQMIPISSALVELLKKGSYPLGAPDPLSLEEMMVRPAERAGLHFEGGLPHRIVSDTGSEPGSLALMAYLLDELYQRQLQRADGRLSRRDYDEMGGVAGAIGKRAEQAFRGLSAEGQKALPHVFRRLVKVDEAGTATRRRASREEIERTAPQAAQELVREFTKARLLVADEEGAKSATVEVAHEALLRSWDRLAAWIRQAQDDLRLVDQVKLAAAEWYRKGRQEAYRWPDERLKAVYEAIGRLELDQEREFSPAEREFIRRESDRLLEEVQNPDTPHLRRRWIGERLNSIGDPPADSRRGVGVRPDGLPEIDWCEVKLQGKRFVQVEIEGRGRVGVDLPFRIARYPITYAQFQAFIDARNGYQWFEGLSASKDDKHVEEQHLKILNHPRDTVNWFQAIAFCRWLSWRLAKIELSKNALLLAGVDLMNPWTWAVRLPTEAEWQLAAAGLSTNEYPWGPTWDGRFANILESGLQRATAVGMYPTGAAGCGALDMIGNVCEWTLTEYESGSSHDLASGEPRVLRGGSWERSQFYARAVSRLPYFPHYRLSSFGFRVVGVVPSH